MSEEIKCIHCGSTLIPRLGIYGKFLACPKWPVCPGTTAEPPAPIASVGDIFKKPINKPVKQPNRVIDI